MEYFLNLDCLPACHTCSDATTCDTCSTGNRDLPNACACTDGWYGSGCD